MLKVFSALGVLSLSAAAVIACGTSTEKTPGTGEPAPSSTEQPAPTDERTTEEEAPEIFGAKLDPNAEHVDFATLIASPDTYRNKTIATEGVVRASCEKRGCWMSVRPEEDRAAEPIMVRFKDYKFFVPIDSRGARVKINGKMTVTLYSPEQVAELEAEGGSVGEKLPDGSAKVILFIATGVEMRGRKKS